MKRIIKIRLKNYLFNIIEGYLNQKFSRGNKWGIKIDPSSWFQLPLEVKGGENIEIGQQTSIGKYSWLAAYETYLNSERFYPKISIGNNVRIGNYACITCINSIEINDGVLISEYFYASDHSHGIDVSINTPPMFQKLETRGGVKIGENCFIGFRVSILPGVVLGKNCVVGSHSVVTKSFPDNCMIAGVPARIIKRYDLDKKKWLSEDQMV